MNLGISARRMAGVVVVAALAASACGSTSPRAGVVETRSKVARAAGGASTAAAVAGTDALAVALYRRLATGDGNLVFSPFSIELALAMTRNGARGETRIQMDDVLGAPAGSALDDSMNALEQALASRSGDFPRLDGTDHVYLSTADRMWTQTGLPFEQPFLDVLARDYGAGVNPVDFSANPETARRAIDSWVSAQTHDKINDLIPEGGVDTFTRIALVNAIYFKAPWAVRFDLPTDEPFTPRSGARHDVPTITGGEHGSYGSGPGWKAAEIPYIGQHLSMVVIEPDDLHSFEATLTGPKLAAITGGLRQNLTSIRLPTFKFDQKFDLAGQLDALGMPDAFDPNRADFSGMTTHDQLLLSHVFHQAYIAVDQHGTEAAAATAVIGETMSLMPGSTLVVDHPFLFAIRDDQTGAILFLGRVTQP
jgi:serpin B